MGIEIWQSTPEFAGSSVEKHTIETDPGVHLRVLVYTPDSSDAKQARTLIMVPGWNSVPDGWFPIMEEWVKLRPIVWIESREKGSCSIDGPISKATFQMPVLAADIPKALAKLGIESSECDAFGASLGATMLLESLREQTLTPRSMVLLAPNLHFTPPIWAGPLIPAPLFLYSGLVRFILWYLDRRLKEEGQRIRYRRTLLAAPIDRLRLCSIVFKRYRMNLDFAHINTTVGVLRASSDTLHDHSDAGRLSQAISNCQLIDVESNQFAHEAGALPIIEGFFDSVG